MDRVSSLPDEVLSHILSFLTTKEAALTSVLSKRWRNLLAFVPNLVIDDSVFLHPEEGKRKSERILQSFIDFVDRVLALQGDSPIKKFSLKCKSNDSVRMNRWICNVLRRGVSDLELFIVRGYTYVSSLSHEAFVRRTKWSPGANFTFSPMLKTLVIDPSGIFSDKIETLLQAFPALQELDLHRFHWSGSGETVSTASLKKLTIYASSCELFINPKSVSFDTPSLLYLEYSDFVSEDYPNLNLANLVEARLNLMAHEGQIKLIRGLNIEDDEVDDVQPCGNVWKLMSAIRNVQKLRLSHDTLEVFSLCCELMPVFNNLKWLRIESCVGWGWQGMPVLLRNCPNLETLVLVGLLHYVTVKCGDACDCISREDKGRSLISCPVKKIQIKGFRGRKREMEMIKHFLEYFPCLKEMEIYPTDSEVPEIFELIVKMVNLYNENYRVVMFTSWYVIYCVGSEVQ